MIPDDPSCWFDDTWVLPRELKELTSSGFLKVLLERAQFNISLDYTTRIAQLVDGPEKGRIVGFLPLFTQFHECPEDVICAASLNRTFKGGKMEVKVPKTFVKSWFRVENGLLFSNLSGGPLPAALNQELAKNEGETDIIPFLKPIFGLSLIPSIMKRIPEFVCRLMAVERENGNLSPEVIILKKIKFILKNK